MRYQTLDHRFVRTMPRELDSGVLYISMDYATAVHLCCCGCGERVVTPFTPTDWRMTFDGETISLNPSVGNWNQSCRSHYVIHRGRVVESGPWSGAQVEAEYRRNKKAKAAQFTHSTSTEVSAVSARIRLGEETKLEEQRSNVWSRIKSWFGN